MSDFVEPRESYVSHSALCHFVGRSCASDDERYDILCRVLSTGVISHPPHTLDWGLYGYTLNPEADLLHGELIVPNMVCFCDIPFSHLQVHMNKYSKFGISILKKQIYRYGGRPVTYYPYSNDDGHYGIYGRHALADLQTQFTHFQRICDDTFGEEPETRSRVFGRSPSSIEEACRNFEAQMIMSHLAYLKPFDVALPIDHPNSYYMEREWRKIGNLKFEPEHVEQIVVPTGHLEKPRLGGGDLIHFRRGRTGGCDGGTAGVLRSG